MLPPLFIWVCDPHSVETVFFICVREVFTQVVYTVCKRCVEVVYGIDSTQVVYGVYTSCVWRDSEFKVLVSRFSTHPPTGDRCVEVLSRTRAMCYIYIYICVAVAHIHGLGASMSTNTLRAREI